MPVMEIYTYGLALPIFSFTVTMFIRSARYEQADLRQTTGRFPTNSLYVISKKRLSSTMNRAIVPAVGPNFPPADSGCNPRIRFVHKPERRGFPAKHANH